ncbi:MAG: hypothetical protein H7Z43_08520 [Clostridia bacterium]|nr:hypothetical protein [Deltaproteobacteria bacterium]
MSQLDKTTKAAFLAYLAQWEKHMDSTSHMSFPSARVNCDAFDKLTAMGDTIVPLIFEKYVDIETPWAAVLAKIKPGHGGGDGLLGDPSVARDQWFAWAKKEGIVR